MSDTEALEAEITALRSDLGALSAAIRERILGQDRVVEELLRTYLPNKVQIALEAQPAARTGTEPAAETTTSAET